MAVVDAINRKLRATVYTAREAGPAAYAVRRGGAFITSVYDPLVPHAHGQVHSNTRRKTGVACAA